MSITTALYQGAEALVIENDCLRAVVLPGHGGKVASLWYRPARFELLFQNPHETFQRARCGDDFSQFEACGFDEAFPTVDACTVRVGGRQVDYPDHGELWSAAFAVCQEGEALRLTFDSPLLGYRYEKRFSLDGSALVCAYNIYNPTEDAIPALWVCHALVQADRSMRLLLPREITQVQNVFSSDWLGEERRLLSYPAAQGPRGPVQLDRMPTDGQLKFYAHGQVKAGWCGYDYPAQGVRVLLYSDPQALPYLGFWATAGGYRGDVNCALEPSNGYYDNIPNAASLGACPVLRPMERWTFRLRFVFSSLGGEGGGFSQSLP